MTLVGKNKPYGIGNAQTTKPKRLNNASGGLVGNLYEVKVDHQYKIRGFMSSPQTDRHACLEGGWWCWANFKEHPQDTTKYARTLLSRLRNRLRRRSDVQ